LKLLLQERNNSMRRSDLRKFVDLKSAFTSLWTGVGLCVLQLTWFVKWEQCHLVLTILGCSQETELRAQINHKETKVEVFIANWYSLQSFSMYVDSSPLNRGQLSIQVHSLCESQGSNSQLSWQKPLYVNVQTLLNSLKELQSEKDAGVNVAEWDAQDLKGQLEELRSHHTTTLGQLVSSSTHFERREGQKVEICEAPVWDHQSSRALYWCTDESCTKCTSDMLVIAD
jgi:hypothetical protein